MHWFPFTVAIIVLLGFGGFYAGFLTLVLGRIVYGPLWRQPQRFTLPRLRFRLANLFALFVVLQCAIAVMQLIWPVIHDTQCLLVSLPRGVATQIAGTVSFLETARETNDLELVDRITASALACGAAIFSGLLGSLLIQVNRIERAGDSLILLLVLAPLGTLSTVLAPTVAGFFIVEFATSSDPPPPFDSILWHGVVLLGGSLLGMIYCRAMAGWIASRVVQLDCTANPQEIETT